MIWAEVVFCAAATGDHSTVVHVLSALLADRFEIGGAFFRS